MEYILLFTSSILSFLVVMFLLKNSISDEISKERYDKVVFPVFELLEPILFKPITAENRYRLDSAIKIIKENKNIAGGKLIEACNRCETDTLCTKADFDKLCKSVNFEYDKCCFALDIPLRRLGYRATREQFKHKHLGMLVYSLIHLAITSLVCILVLSVIANLVLIIYQ